MQRGRRAAVIPVLAALIALCAVGTDVLAQVKKSKGAKSVSVRPAAAWTFTRALGVPTLSYGFEAKDEFQISFSCQPEAGLLRVISFIGSRGLRPGDGAAIRLSNGKARFEVAGTAFSAENQSHVDIAGTTRFDATLFTIFRQGETALLEVPGLRRTLSLNNAKAAAEAFEKACAGKRSSN